MPLLKRELARHARGPVSSEEDWWRLVFDTDQKRLYVEHHMDVRRGGPTNNGVAEIEIATFLNESGQGNAHRELVRLLTSLVEGK